MTRANPTGRFLFILFPAAALVFLASLYPCASPALSRVLSHQKISQTQGGFSGILGNQYRFGNATAPLGDMDGDGLSEVAVGCYFYGYGEVQPGPGPGAIFVLSLYPSGTVRSHVLITNGQGGFTGVLDAWDDFGRDVAAIGDLDGDGVQDLAVGAGADDDGGFDRGAVWILFMNSIGTVKSHQKISQTQGGFAGVLMNQDFFGSSLACLGDLDGDGKPELAVGAREDDDGGLNRGAVWILSMNTNGTVASHVKISSTSGGFTGILGDDDRFGISAAALGDLDGDGVSDLAVGAHADDTGGADRGAVWILFLNANGTVQGHQKIASGQGGFTGVLDDADNFGASLGLVTSSGCSARSPLAAGAVGDDDGGTDRGAVWLLDLAADGTVISHQKISQTQGGFTGALRNGDNFGQAVQPVGDLNGDGAVDLSVGAYKDDDGGTDRGAVWILFLAPAVVEPSFVEFDTLLVGKESEEQFTIINTSCEVLIGVVTESSPHFSIVSGGHYEIQPAESLAVTVRFMPEWAGAHECTVDVGCGLTVLLTGVGLETEYPWVQSIRDVGNDQGRSVRIEFTRSGRDAPGSPTPVLQYEAFRRIDPLPSLSQANLLETVRPDARARHDVRAVRERAARYSADGMLSAPGEFLVYWEFVGAIPSHGDERYFMIAPTLADSTVEHGIHWSVFFVRAATANPVVYFDSPPDSGYSLDNLAPNIPQGFSVAYNSGGGNELAWEPSPDTDFRFFNVYRDTDPDFVPGPANLAHQTVQTAWVDAVTQGWQYAYKLTAVDFAGNESDPASPGAVTGFNDRPVPRSYALHENVPNPFNPSTNIRFDVPAGGGDVTIEIFDVRGHLVSRLAAGHESEGSKTIVWRGVNDRGEDAASGVYFCRMTAPGFVETRKLVMLR